MRKRSTKRASSPERPKTVKAPEPHPSGARPPVIPAELVPQHVALVMDGNGRWANQRGLTRIEGHRRGEQQVVEVAKGCIELGVKWLSLYAFSTENWKRSPEEIRFIMGYSRETIANRTDELDELGVRIRWAGRKPRLWRSVISTLETAEERTQDNTVLNLAMCINYGGRAELGDAAREIARLAAAGKINPEKVDDRTLARHLYVPEMPDVDLFIRPSGEHRTSNFMLWQSAYAELVFQDILWPDFDRLHLWQACEDFAKRDRRYGGAIDKPGAAEPGN
ncbi:isoprenyl transferase [Pseudonocardiaceae bacterium YIM PH 21723]|nr:isoprenyl transferase [Pseudonocardiaceae bacterium YIM PH 21723]